MATSRDEIAALLAHAEGLTGMAAADVLRSAARAQREVDAAGAARTLERAIAALAQGPADPRRVASIELELGQIFERDLGRLEEAIQHYQKSFKVDLSNVDAIDAGRRIYRSLGDFAMVARLYEVELDVTASPRRRAELLVELGRTLAGEVRDLPSAVARFEEALKLRDDDDQARELLAGVYSHPDFPSVGGSEALTRAVQLLLDLAESRRRRNDEEGQLGFLRRALGVDPSSFQAARAIEVIFQRTGNRDELRRLYRTSEGIAHRALKLAQIAEEAGDREEALSACFEAMVEPDEAPEAGRRIERLLAAGNDFAGLAAIREQGLGELEAPGDVERGRERADRLVEVAELYLKAGQSRKAVERLEGALASDPLHPVALAVLEKELAARKEHGRFVRALEAAAAAAPDGERAERLAQLADYCEKRAGDAERALDAWTRAEELQPTERGTAELRRLTSKIDRWDGLLTLLAKELAKATDDATRIDVWRRTAQVYRERHDVETAAELYETVLQVRPDDPVVLRALADLWEREGDYGKVVAVIRRQLAVPVLQKVERLNLLRRLAHLAEERLDDAEAVVWACREVLRELPGDRDSLKRMAATCERIGDQQGLLEAIELHAQAAATPSEKVPLLLRAARLHEQGGDAQAAAERLERAVKLQPNDAGAVEMLGRCYQAAGRWPDLAALLEKGLLKGDADGWRRFARVVGGELKDRARAEKAWREVLKRLPRDREALEALIALARARADAPALAQLLERRAEISDQPEEAIQLAGERAEILEQQLNDRAGAIAALEKLIHEVAPRDLALHARLKAMAHAAGDIPRAVAVAERELFLAEGDQNKLAIAIEIAELWAESDPRRASEAWERVLRTSPEHPGALVALIDLYRRQGEWGRLIELDEQRLAQADRPEALRLLAELSEICERHTGDFATALHYRRVAWELDPGDETLAQVDRVASEHALWEELIAVYQTIEGLDSKRTTAEIAERELEDPRRALSILIDALAFDPHGDVLLSEIERLAQVAVAPEALLEVYEQMIEASEDPAVRLDLVGRRAQVRERAGDASGAFVERLRQYRMEPEDPSILEQLRRLGEVTGRWEDLLTVEGDRFQRADGPAKLDIARFAARLVETRLGDRVRAFRAYLTAFALAPDDPEVLSEIWRLARSVGSIADEPLRRPNVRESTLELDIDDLRLAVGGDETPPPPPSMVIRANAVRPRPEPTLQLSPDELEFVADDPGAAPQAPPRRRGAPPPPPPPRAPARAHSAWDELERAYLALPAPTDDERIANLIAVARAWEEGAGDLSRAFDALGRAFRIDPDSAEAREALDRLAKAHDAWDRLVQILDRTVEASGSSERTVRLLIDAAAVQERVGQTADAEERYRRILGIRPDCEEAMSRLEQLYQGSGRLPELAVLLERRTTGLLERLPPGEERRTKLADLARTYEAMGSPYEAIEAWGRLLAEDDESLDALRANARLYEQVGQWSRVIDALTRIAGQAGEDEARAAQRRKAEILEKELELPERAMEAYATLDASVPSGDDEARTALERLYTKHHRHRELEQLLRRRCASATSEVLAGLLERRARLLTDSLMDFDGAAVCLRELFALRPDDDAIAGALEGVLGRAGKVADQAEVLKRRIDLADRRGATARTRADLLIRLGALHAGPLADAAAAQKTLQRALALVPDDPSAIAELARLREGGSDWLGYAAARVREAEVAPDGPHAARALCDAARVQAEKLSDDDAAKWCLDRALERDPSSLDALSLLGQLQRRRHDDAAADSLCLRELELLPPVATSQARRAQIEADLGASALRRGDGDEAGRRFREALGASPDHLPAIYGLADLARVAERWDEVEALLTDATEREGLTAQAVAGLWRRVAEARERQGHMDEAYAALLDADRLVHGDIFTRRLLGENRFRAARWREAAQHLTAVSEHPEAAALGREAAEACYHGALAELKLRRPERAEPLYRRAIEICPDYVPALTALAEIAIDHGDLPTAVDLFERRAEATVDQAERASLFAAVGDLIIDELKDPARARVALRKAADAAGDGASERLLERRLSLAREANDIDEAAALAERLLDRSSEPAVRSARLRDAASLMAAAGKPDAARERLREALEVDPHDEEALAGLSGLLVAAGDDDGAAQLLTRTLALLAPPDPERRMARAVLWRRLGEARDRQRDTRGAVAAFEHALEANPSLRDLRELVLSKLAGDSEQDEIARRHLSILIADDPLHVPSLRALAQLEVRGGDDARARRLTELLAVSGAATDEELRGLRHGARTQASDELYKGGLEERDHEQLAHPDAGVLGEIFAALWEGTAASAPGLDSLGLRAEERISPVADLEVAKAFGACARALGNRRTALFIKRDPDFSGVVLVAQPPTAVVVGPALADGRVTAGMRFVLGRALEIARPEYVLGAALPPEEFTKLFSTILRSFHPRHARRAETADEVAHWKRKLPYKVAQRLGELLRAHAETEFSSARWRRAVQHTGNRAGLLLCGDLLSASSVLKAEGDEPAIRELARFAASEQCAQLQAKINNVMTLSY